MSSNNFDVLLKKIVKLVEKLADDDEFRKALERDPRTTLADEGIELPETVNIPNPVSLPPKEYFIALSRLTSDAHWDAFYVGAVLRPSPSSPINWPVVPSATTSPPGHAESRSGAALYGPGIALYGAGASLYGPGAALYGAGASLYGPGASLYGAGASLYGPGAALYGAGAALYGPGAALYGPGASLYGAGASLYGPGAALYGAGAGLYGPGAPLYGAGASLYGPGAPLYGAGASFYAPGGASSGANVVPYGPFGGIFPAAPPVTGGVVVSEKSEPERTKEKDETRRRYSEVAPAAPARARHKKKKR